MHDEKSLVLLSELDNFFVRLAFLLLSLLKITCKRNLDAVHPSSYTQIAGYNGSQMPV